MLVDIRPGIQSSNPTDFATVDSIAFFHAQDTTGNYRLWRTDGTATGTYPISPPYSVIPNISDSRFMRTVGNHVFYVIPKSEYHNELWTSDGSITGTLKVADVPGTPWSTYTGALSLNGKYLIILNDGEKWLEWWVSDGTLGGTKMLKEAVGESLIFYNHFQPTILENYFYYIVNGELWRTDGTTENTYKVFTSLAGFDLLPATDTHLFFLTSNSQGIRLWKSDGTNEGTEFLKYVSDANYSSLGGNDWAAATTSKHLCFPISQKSGATYIRPMVISDGTVSGTNFLEGIIAPELQHGLPENFRTASNGDIAFRAQQSSIWYAEKDNPFAVKQIGIPRNLPSHWTQEPYVLNDKVLWFSKDSIHRLWAWTPGAQGTTIALQSPPAPNAGSFGEVVNNKLIFPVNSRERLWQSDGTANGTSEFFTLPNNERVESSIVISDTMYFAENTPPRFLWATDGTFDGTKLIDSLTTNGNVRLRNINGHVGFETNNGGTTGRELYIRNKARLVLPGISTTPLAGYELVQDRLFVLGQQNPGNIHHLWLYENETLTNLYTFVAISGYVAFSVPSVLPKDLMYGFSNGTLLFGAGIDEENIELWRSDGTTAGTFIAYEINPDGSSWPDNLVQYNDSIWIFTVFDGEEWAWWYTNGTWWGTHKIIGLPTSKCSTGAGVLNPTLFGDRLFFALDDGVHGIEPWVLQFTTPLTVSLKHSPHPRPNNKFTIQPNPASGHVAVYWQPQYQPVVAIELMDGLGRVVLREVVSDQASAACSFLLPTSLPNGAYWLRMLLSDSVTPPKPLIVKR